MFTPGTGPLALTGGAGVEICKDMDFPAMLRTDSVRLAPGLMAVPAWDFERDAFAHARMALMRSVENGFSMARAARNGLLTLSDAYGRILAVRASGSDDGFVAVTGEVPAGLQGGRTLYDRIGDAFAWGCLILSATLLVLALVRRRVINSNIEG
jgi:apolipoprotein N-acyltransferase